MSFHRRDVSVQPVHDRKTESMLEETELAGWPEVQGLAPGDCCGAESSAPRPFSLVAGGETGLNS